MPQGLNVSPRFFKTSGFTGAGGIRPARAAATFSAGHDRHPVPHFDRGAAKMRKEHHGSQFGKAFGHLRFVFVHVEPCSGDAAVSESGDQGFFIHDRATARVDQDRRGFHQAEFPYADQMPGFRQERNVERHEIRFGQQIVETDPARRRRFPNRSVP
jgi:hypothetical protein